MKTCHTLKHHIIIITGTDIHGSKKVAHQAFKTHWPSQISICDNSIVWPGIKSLTHFSLWQLRRLYFPSHCGQEAVFIRASDAEIVSCLRSCQFQLVREQLSPIPRHSLVTLSPPSDWSPPPDPGLSLVESLLGLWSQSEPLAWIHNNLETDNTILCSLATSGETILVGPG